jgi:hypothetical protein
VLRQRWIDAREEPHHVAEVLPEVLLRLAVLRRHHHLREVDDDGPVVGQENVELREVSVDEVGREHLDDLSADRQVQPERLLRRDMRVDQPRRHPALGITDDLHQQHAFVKQDRPRHSNSGRVQLRQRVGLGRLPRLLRGLAAELGAAVHRPLGAAVAHGPPLAVPRVILEAAKLASLVELGGDGLPPVAHQPDLCFFPGLQLAVDLVDDSVFENFLQTIHYSLIVPPLGLPRPRSLLT